MTTIESRFAAVERQLRFHRLVIASLLVALVALVGYGATDGVPDVIRAKKFLVVNEEGREVVVIESWLLGGYIRTFPAKGTYLPSITLSHIGFDGLLKVSNKDGKDIIQTGADTTGNGLLKISNKDGKDIIQNGTNMSGDGLLRVYNKDGGVGVTVQGINSIGSGGGVLVFNRTGEPVIQAHADEYGVGVVGAYDRHNKGRTLTPR